jgi:hypothetical protein
VDAAASLFKLSFINVGCYREVDSNTATGSESKSPGPVVGQRREFLLSGWACNVKLIPCSSSTHRRVSGCGGGSNPPPLPAVILMLQVRAIDRDTGILTTAATTDGIGGGSSCSSSSSSSS